ncbi:MAG: hypothetical protein NE327_22360 [Lentisphaeraceae bacterium]|nr:hypothetical protein [Lentisphaeraceae bacterium]
MSHPTSELKIGEPDNPNTVAIYVIIVCCLVGLAITFWGLAEYKGYLEEKRQNKIQTMQFEQREALNEAEKPLTDIINKAVESK